MVRDVEIALAGVSTEKMPQILQVNVKEACTWLSTKESKTEDNPDDGAKVKYPREVMSKTAWPLKKPTPKASSNEKPQLMSL
jgi:hypothetical protein